MNSVHLCGMRTASVLGNVCSVYMEGNDDSVFFVGDVDSVYL